EWFHKKKVSPKNLVEVDVDGDSMEPRIPSGSVVKMTRILCHRYLEYPENVLIYMNKENNPFGENAIKKPDGQDQAS
ncbi:hypothetical protein CKK01_17345, partial [Acinetobacter baumannii]|nr:hypothetical protein [Acinetobacter baumannii]